MATNLALPREVGTTLALQVLSATLGPAARLVDPFAPVECPRLSSLVIATPGSPVGPAVQLLRAPLLALQEKLWALAAEPPSLLVGTPTTQDPAEEDARRHPVLLLTDPGYAEVSSAMSRSQAGSLLAVLGAGALERFWTKVHIARNGARLGILVRWLAGQHVTVEAGRRHREVLYLAWEARMAPRPCRSWSPRCRRT